MSMSRRASAGVLAAGLACLLTTYTLAQQLTPGQPGTTSQPRSGQPGEAGAGSEVNRYLASCWQANNEAEIEISRLAQQEAQNPQVKDFAQKMVQEHSELTRKLQPIAGTQPTAAGAQPGAPRTSATSAESGQAIDRLIQIDKQIVDSRTDMVKQELEEKSGAQFDQCYINGQVVCHMQASAALGVIAKQSSGQLQQLASQAKQSVDQHLQQAKQLAKQLEQRQGGQQAGVFRDPSLRPAAAER